MVECRSRKWANASIWKQTYRSHGTLVKTWNIEDKDQDAAPEGNSSRKQDTIQEIVVDSVYTRKVVHPSWEGLSVTVPQACPRYISKELTTTWDAGTNSFIVLQLRLSQIFPRNSDSRKCRGKVQTIYCTSHNCLDWRERWSCLRSLCLV